MPWDRSSGTNPKYRTKRHRDERAKWARTMDLQGWLYCAQPVCVERTRLIEQGQRWHLGHDDTGTTYIGPCHERCNITDGARRGRGRQDVTTIRL